jgi:hypothetical protein
MANPIITASSQEFSQVMTQFFTDRYHETVQELTGGSTLPLMSLLGNTPLKYSTANEFVIASWHIMIGVADAFLGLFVLISILQIFYGDYTGMVHLPIRQFLGKFFLVVILIHLSLTIVQDLIILTNTVCGAFQVDLRTFLLRADLQVGPATYFRIVIAFAFIISFIRVLFQSGFRVVRLVILAIFGPLAMLSSLHPATAPIFSAWTKLVAIAFLEQLLQTVGFQESIHFFLQVGQNGGTVTTFFLATAMTLFVAQIPGLLARFGGGTADLGSLSQKVLSVAMLFR